MESFAEKQYYNQIEFYIGELQNIKSRAKYRLRLYQIVSRDDFDKEMQLIALLNEVESLYETEETAQNEGDYE